MPSYHSSEKKLKYSYNSRLRKSLKEFIDIAQQCFAANLNDGMSQTVLSTFVKETFEENIIEFFCHGKI